MSRIILIVFVVALLLADGVLYSGILEGEHAASASQFTGRGAPNPSGGVPAPTPTLTPSQGAELDDSPSLPGRFVPAQGRQHTAPYPLKRHVEFCKPDGVDDSCYASNPPTSGLHLPVQGTVRLADGNRLKIPPDPGIYDFAVPREAIPHIEEHAGVYLGYNCASDACSQTVERIKDLVSQELSLGARVVMSPDPDLGPDTVGLASWTRVDDFAAADYSDERVRSFIKAHSCRFDPEQFCRPTPIN